jgi:hypothetical protein
LGLKGFVGTLQTGYPRIQASSQDKEQGVHPRAAICFAAPDLTPCRRDLRRCRVSCSSEPRLPTEAGSDDATCPTAPDLTSLPRWAPVSGLSSQPRRAPALPRVPRLRTPPPYWGGLQCCHTPHGSLWTATSDIKKGLAIARLACFQGALTCFQGAWAIIDCKTCGQAAPLRHARRAARQHH